MGLPMIGGPGGGLPFTPYEMHDPRLLKPFDQPSKLAQLLARPGLRDALLATGSALLSQSDQPGTLGGALGRALPLGLQAYQQGQQGAEIDKLLASAPPGMQALIRALPREQQVAALLRMQQRPEPVAVAANTALVDPTTGTEVYRNTPAPEPDKPPADVQTFREYLQMSPDERSAFDAFLERKRGPGTTVNVGAAEGGVAKAIGEGAYETITGDDSASGAVDKVATIDRITGIVNNPKFRSVSGPLFGGTFGELSSRFAEDPEARTLLAEFNALGGQMTMAQLEAFTGPKTDFEFQQARRLAFNDTKMTPEEIAAGLRVYRRAAIDDARKWAKNLLDLDPQRLNFDPRDIAPQLELARDILDRYGERAPNTRNDPLGIR